MESPYRTAGETVAGNAFCLYCGGMVEDAICTRCRLAYAAASPLAATLVCPRCDVALGGEQLDTIVIAGCPTCRGCFVARAAWDEIVGEVDARVRPDTKSLVPPPPNVAPSIEALFRPSPCPSCRSQMDRVTFAAGSRTVIDVCAAHGTWFDALELIAVLRVLSQRLDGIEPHAAELSQAERETMVARMRVISEHARVRLASIPIRIR